MCPEAEHYKHCHVCAFPAMVPAPWALCSQPRAQLFPELFLDSCKTSPAAVKSEKEPVQQHRLLQSPSGCLQNSEADGWQGALTFSRALLCFRRLCLCCLKFVMGLYLIYSPLQSTVPSLSLPSVTASVYLQGYCDTTVAVLTNPTPPPPPFGLLLISNSSPIESSWIVLLWSLYPGLLTHRAARFLGLINPLLLFFPISNHRAHSLLLIPPSGRSRRHAIFPAIFLHCPSSHTAL